MRQFYFVILESTLIIQYIVIIILFLFYFILERKRVAELKEAGVHVGPIQPQDHEKTFYPKYDDFEVYAGEDPKNRQDRWKDYKNPYMTPEEDQVTKKSK